MDALAIVAWRELRVAAIFFAQEIVAHFRKVYKKCQLLVKKIKAEIGFSCQD